MTVDLGHDRALFGISVAAELTGVNAQMLRTYEAKGLLEPHRTDGGKASLLLLDRAHLLEPGARVRYRVGRPGAWSPVRTFAPAPAGREFTFAHLGDHGCTADSTRTARKRSRSC